MDKLFEKLNSWLDVLHKEVYNLRVSQHIFWEVQVIIKSNSTINVSNHYYRWMGSMYAAATSVAIRRQVDLDPKSISFLRLLVEIKENPEVLSRERYKANYLNDDFPEDFADYYFDKFAGAGRAYVDPSAIEQEINQLRDKTHVLKKYVNKRVAHYDRKNFIGFPTYQDIDDAIELLENLLVRYMQLFRAIDYKNHVNWQYDWKAIFRHPWIIDESQGK